MVFMWEMKFDVRDVRDGIRCERDQIPSMKLNMWLN